MSKFTSHEKARANTITHSSKVMPYDEIINLPVYALNQKEKQKLHHEQLSALTHFHATHCQPYQHFISAYCTETFNSPACIPPFAVRHFKERPLSSVPSTHIHRNIQSSGTTGSPSNISLDSETAKLQSSVLVKTLQEWLGKTRRPMLIIDAKSTLRKKEMNARAAGIRGFSLFGREHCYALNDDLSLNLSAVSDFFEKHQHTSILLFGFTFIIWQKFIQACQKQQLHFHCEDALLIHGGGWKKMTEKSVSNATFKSSIQEILGQVSVHDYYGMVEQTGTIHLECEKGFLHTPIWADIIIRRPFDLSVANTNEIGIIQVNSLLARSYPGHCLLTEDLGMLLGEDNCECGRKGKYFIVQGRVPKAEIRGCSDTFS